MADRHTPARRAHLGHDVARQAAGEEMVRVTRCRYCHKPMQGDERWSQHEQCHQETMERSRLIDLRASLLNGPEKPAEEDRCLC
ncbi:MAG: hypothetical protein ACYTBJ_21765 [Planctomycetota bacterium]